MRITGTTIMAYLLLTAAVLTVRPGVLAQTPKPDAPPPATANAISKEDDQAIRKVVTGYEEAWNAHDMKAISKLFREDAEFINVVGMHWRGRDTIVKAHAIFHEIMFKDCRFKTDSIETRPLGGDHAIAVWTATQDSYATPSGQVVPKGQFKLSAILTKGPEGWKIAHGHNVRVDVEAAKNDPVNGPKK